MELRQLRYFVAITEERSFTRAARKLGVAQPALSQQLRALELELGVTLLQRSNRTGDLTDAGVSLLARATRILGEVRDTVDEMADHAGARRGVVRIGCALQTLMECELPTLLSSLRASHPRIRIVLREMHTRQVLHRLDSGKVDLGLVHLARHGSEPLVGTERVSDQLVLRQMYREPLVLIVGPKHRLAKEARIAFAALREEAWIAFGVGATVRRVVELAADTRGFVPRIAFTSTNIGTVRALVSAGLGIAVVPRSALDVPSPPLHAVQIIKPTLERVVTLARNPARYESNAVAIVSARLVESLGPRARSRR
jgi:DNA-binding transcriptional LysR family regulator